MRMRWLWCLTFGLSLWAFPAHGEFICRADVSYKWLRAKSSLPASSGGEDKPEGGAGETTVRFAAVERVGFDEAAAKSALNPDVNRIKVRATEACKRDHENLAGCVASKFNIQSSTLSGLSFSARRELEKAVTSDCQAQLGTCVTAVSSDPACEAIKKPEPPTVAPAPGADKKKK